MKKIFLTILLSCITIAVFCQTKSQKIKTIGVSIPVIWNNSEATFYQLGSKKTPTGKAVSYGININHSRTVYKNLYGSVGVGYFRQIFSIRRPFNFDSPYNLAYYTESYNYSTIYLNASLGYLIKINSKNSLNTGIQYNQFFSLWQKYIVNKEYKTWQKNHQLFSLGNIIIASLGMEKNITPNISIGLNCLVPFSTRWNNDEIFINSSWGTDSQQIGRTKSSIGASITCNYHF